MRVSEIMEHFKLETEAILQQLRDDQISYSEAIVALDVAFAALIPRLADGQNRPLRAVFLANRELAIKELNRQKRTRKAVPVAPHLIAGQIAMQSGPTPSLDAA